MSYEYRINWIQLKNEEKEDFINYIGDFLKSAYKEEVVFFDKIEYNSEPGLVLQLRGKAHLEILVVASKTPLVKIVFLDENGRIEIAEALASFIGKVASSYRKKSTLYYVYVYGKSIQPAKVKSLIGRLVEEVFLNNMALFFAFSTILYSLISLVFDGGYTPLAFIALLLPFQFFSYKIPVVIGDWEISSEKNRVLITGLPMPLKIYKKLIDRIVKTGEVYKLKEEIYRLILEGKKCFVKDIILKCYDVNLRKEDIRIKEVNLFRLAKKAFSKIGLPPPKIYLVNSLDLNAAALGIHPSFSSIIVTSGLLIELEENEVEAVLAHEASHIKHRDTFTLYVLSSVLYLIQAYLAYITLPLLLALSLRLGIICTTLTIFFFIAKIIEVKADLDAAWTNNPSSLAFALEKIAPKRSKVEKRRRLKDWISWTSHPPLSFRIYVLRNYPANKHGWLTALKLCICDLARSII